MNAQRFEALLETYGAEPLRWPEAERPAAQAFSRTAQGQAAIEAARALDDELDAWVAVQPSRELRARVLAAAPGPRRWALPVQWVRLWAPGAGLAAAGLAGVLFGVMLSGGGADSSAESLLAEAGAYDDAALTVEAAL